MQRLLVRTTLVSLVIALTIFAVPSMAVGYLLLRDDRAMSSPEQAYLVEPWQYFAGLALLAGLTVLVALVWVCHYSRRAAVPLTTLAEQAERLGAGDARFTPTESGIAEVDRVSQVLSSSARHLMMSLSSERDFASDASHQLRTPLTALLMRLEEISLTDDLEAAREEATIAIEQVERLTDTVDTLLSRSRQGKKNQPDSVSLDTVLAAMQREWQPAFGADHRVVRVTGERGLRVRSTIVALSQIMSTLVENSLSHGKGTVRIDARRSGPSVVVEVSDQGSGIDPALAPHIFERSVSTKSSGLGLGLARDVAESHGGRLELVQGQPVVFALFLSAADAG
ncbi:MAG TPA: HAMP domain-containing sensor histidine kinase [Dermatophilaceae bacterium]|nr:HAMP domain-containing sensor histidine kinase [Dermatophilaceae bacterium]